MDTQTQDQLILIINNLTDQNHFVPFVHTLRQNTVFGPLVKQFDDETLQEVIKKAISQRYNSKTTKGSQYFCRCMEVENDLFRTFRDLNEQKDKNNTDTQAFHDIGKQMEEKLFFYESKLTEKMTKQAKGLDKTINAFYTLVYEVFPYFNSIGNPEEDK